MSLKQNQEKIKSFYNESSRPLFWAIIVFLTIFDAYMLGYISKIDKTGELALDFDEEIEITAEDLNFLENKTENKTQDSTPGSIVASKNGTKYYFIWCSGVGRIKDENKIFFKTEEEAQNLGYSVAKNCQ